MFSYWHPDKETILKLLSSVLYCIHSFFQKPQIDGKLQLSSYLDMHMFGEDTKDFIDGIDIAAFETSC